MSGHRGRMASAEEHDHDMLRRRLSADIMTIHNLLPDTDLSVREQLDVRRDLVFLLGESHRSPFRPEVVEVLWGAVLEGLGPAAGAAPLRGRGDAGGITRGG